MEQEILAKVQTYLEYSGENVSDEFILLLIDRLVGEYKELRNFPEDMDEEAIQADVEAYFRMKGGYVATEAIPAMLGKVGGEGLYSLVDNQVSKNWKYPFPVYLPDVIPYCEVV